MYKEEEKKGPGLIGDTYKKEIAVPMTVAYSFQRTV